VLAAASRCAFRLRHTPANTHNTDRRVCCACALLCVLDGASACRRSHCYPSNRLVAPTRPHTYTPARGSCVRAWMGACRRRLPPLLLLSLAVGRCRRVAAHCLQRELRPPTSRMRDLSPLDLPPYFNNFFTFQERCVL